MRHSVSPHLHALAVGALFLTLGTASARAGETGGTAAPQPVPPAEAGGAGFSSIPPNARPVAHLSVAAGSPAGRPRLRVRFTEPGVPVVTAWATILRTGDGSVAARVTLGRVRVGRTVAIGLPTGLRLRAGHYVVRVTAHDAARHALKRPGRLAFSVAAATPPAPKPTPEPVPTPSPTDHGVFPVAGPHSYGDPFGTPRVGYRHQGQDVLGAKGTPLVAPLGGTIATVGSQPSAAGYYVVLNASNGHAYFFAHCEQGSTAVTTGQAVHAGDAICGLGESGDATGPHVHFEEWVGGWRVDASSHPIDPLPQLKAWEG